MGVDQLVSGGDVSNPVYESLTTEDLLTADGGLVSNSTTTLAARVYFSGSVWRGPEYTDGAHPTHNPQDVRNISSPSQGEMAYHDGSGTNTEGLAAYNGTDWISQVDGSTIS